MRITLFAAVITAAMTTSTFAQSEADKLHQLFDARHAWEMDQYPEMAMSKGDYSNADHLTDMSLAAIEKRQNSTKSDLERLRAILPPL